MTDFVNFARAHGILIDSLPPVGVWRRYPTDDHPHKKNGAVKYMGDHGFVQNHATQTSVSVWKTEKPTIAQQKSWADAARMVEQETQRRQREAAGKAAWILKQCQYGFHDYLKRKGFPEETGNIWVKDGQHLLVIPMRVDGHLVGCQLIDIYGKKKFLSGQQTSHAAFVFDNKGINVFCEGYATALSVRQILKNYKRRYTIHVCFSAGNMEKVAKAVGEGVVIADNDASGTGQAAAERIGLPYWISDQVGEDLNDYHLRLGLFRAGQSLLKLI